MTYSHKPEQTTPNRQWLIKELLEFVRYTKLESDAVANINLIINGYEKRMSFKERLILLLKYFV